MRPLPDTARSAPPWLIVVGLVVLLFGTALLFLCVGAVLLTPSQLYAWARAEVVGEAAALDAASRSIAGLRFPRLALGAASGAALAVSGTALQALFRNPLVDPGLIGVSAGAALAAAGVTVLGASWLADVGAMHLEVRLLPFAAFMGGLLAVGLVHRLGRVRGVVTSPALLLAGVAITALASAATGLLIFVASDLQVRTLLFWNLGSLGAATQEHLAIVGIVVAATAALLRETRSLDAYLLGDGAARLLGYDVAALRRRVLAATALAVGASVACTGVIGFIGLVVPHLLRPLLGAGHTLLLPASALLGASLLLAADTLARTVVAPAELPLGIMTALIGAPVFLWLLRREPQALGDI